jgi:hypothetical protein
VKKRIIGAAIVALVILSGCAGQPVVVKPDLEVCADVCLKQGMRIQSFEPGHCACEDK